MGNLTDDHTGSTVAGLKTYKYDVWGRLRTVTSKKTNSLIAEYRSNGLRMRIGWHYDADASGTVDSSDPWYFFCYDEAWRVVATFRAGDTYPKERFIPHLAGLGGQGGSSYIDSVLMRDSDSAAWTAAGSSTLSIRRYYCQNWRGDVSLIVKASGAPVEWVKYAAYGEPFSIKAGDANSDGNCTGTGAGTDYATINGWIGSSYDVRGDLDGDGKLDSSDLALFSAETLGRGIQSSSGTANRIGYAGYQWEPNTTKYLARHRWYDQRLGRWMNRDPIGYVDGPNLYEYVEDAPIESVDPDGLISTECVGECAGGEQPTGPTGPTGPGAPTPTPPWIPIPTAPPWGPPPPPKIDPYWQDCESACLYIARVWKAACLTCTKGKGASGKAATQVACQSASDKPLKECLAGCTGTPKNYAPPTSMYAAMCAQLKSCSAAMSCGSTWPSPVPLPPSMPYPPPGGPRPKPPPKPPGTSAPKGAVCPEPIGDDGSGVDLPNDLE